MQTGTLHAFNMKMIQIRNVPDELHRRLKARAAMAGLSLSESALRELERSLECPSREEFLDRLPWRDRIELSPSAAELVRAERDSR